MKSNRSQECANASENLTCVRIGDAEVMLGGVRKRGRNVRETGGGISLPTVARFLSADLPSKPKTKTIK